MNVEDYMARAPTFAVYDGFCKTKSVMDQHSRILVSVSADPTAMTWSMSWSI